MSEFENQLNKYLSGGVVRTDLEINCYKQGYLDALKGLLGRDVIAKSYIEQEIAAVEQEEK